MTRAPWWGWLILIITVLLAASWLAVAVISTRAMRRMGQDFNARTRDIGGRYR